MNEQHLKKLNAIKAEYHDGYKVADAYCFFDKETEDTVDEGFMCNHCSYICDTEREMIEHMKECHPDNMRARDEEVLETFQNGKLVMKFELDNANPHLNYAIEEFDGRIVGFIGINCNYCSWKEVIEKNKEDRVETFHYKSNVQQKYLKAKIQEVLDMGIDNKKVYAWLQENGKYSIRYQAEKRLDF